MIVIKNKKCSLSNILKEYPNAEIFDVTSKVGAINEYNFGSGTWNAKSLWNTLDFEPSYVDPNTGNLILKSPFAYNDNKSKNNGQNYIA